MLPPQNEWQILDNYSGVLYPWYTSEAINYIETYIQYDKANVLEFGSGHSTIWWAINAKHCTSVESDYKWYSDIKETLRASGIYCNLHWCDELSGYESIVKHYSHLKNIIMVVDGEYRDECCNFALKYLPKGSILICDNWMQPEVWEAGEHVRNELLNKEHKIFKQPGHNTWQTAIFWI